MPTTTTKKHMPGMKGKEHKEPEMVSALVGYRYQVYTCILYPETIVTKKTKKAKIKSWERSPLPSRARGLHGAPAAWQHAAYQKTFVERVSLWVRATATC